MLSNLTIIVILIDLSKNLLKPNYIEREHNKLTKLDNFSGTIINYRIQHKTIIKSDNDQGKKHLIIFLMIK